MNIVTIPLDQVDVGDRLRAVDEDYAQIIAASMQEDGQRTPIEVRTAGADGLHRLIAGAHRVRAAQIAGLATVDAVMLKVSDLEAQRLEIEENLCRHELTALDRSVFLARWKGVYEELNEAARHGGRRAKGQVAKVGHLTERSIERFTAVASERLGMSERVIRRANTRFEKIKADVRTRISGTWLADNGSELDLLARMTPEVQRKVVALMQARGATSLRGLREEVMGIRAPVPDADEAQFDALVKLWRRTGAIARRRFEAELAKDHLFDLKEKA